jgi:hypothetical protein
MRLTEAGDPFGCGGEHDPMPGLAGPDTDPYRDMCPAGARWSRQDGVLLGHNEVQRGQMRDDLAPSTAARRMLLVPHRPPSPSAGAGSVAIRAATLGIWWRRGSAAPPS